jgi:AGCS family alanine or glycine:cation symporter
MLVYFLSILEQLNDLFLGYVALIGISLLGAYFAVITRFFQIRNFPLIVKSFFRYIFISQKGSLGVHPLKAFFASVGGMIGIGNIVAVTTAITVGGPGALFWTWMAACLGALIKYSEIFLGHKYRVINRFGGYDGGPMYFLRHAFPWAWVSPLVCVLLCIYGTEVYQFSVIVHSVSTNLELNRSAVIVVLLISVLYAGIGGVARVGKICSFLMPFFTLAYLGMCFWVIFQNFGGVAAILREVIHSAFSGHAAAGGFAGATIIMALQHGVARAAYSADIGIGYDSIIQSESALADPTQQARLSILGVFLDNLVCTCSILVILLTGVWKLGDTVPGSQMVQVALSSYFSGMQVFIPLLIVVLGYSTIIAYYCVCLKCARFLHPTWGARVYIAVSIPIFILFSFCDQSQALLVMSIAQSLLLMLNLAGIFRLRNQIEFREDQA